MNNDNQYIPSGYKPSPLGIIPEDWEVKRLGEIAELSSGTTPSRTNNDFYSNGSIPWVKTTDLNNSILYSTEELVTNKALEKTSLKLLPKGTILVAMYGGFNQIGRTAMLGIEATINQALSALICNERIYNSFLLAWLNCKVKEWKHLAASSRKDPNITGKDVARFPIAVPPIEEQQRIVSVLSLWDTAIEKQTTLIEQLTLRKRGLMQQLLTGKKRLKGFSEEWKKIKAGDIFKSVSDRGNENEVLLSATQEHGVIPRDQLEGRVTMPTGDLTSFKLVEKGDFVISLRSFQGGLEYSYFRGIVSPAYTVLKPKIEIDKSFYRFYFKSSDFIGHLAIAVIGIRDGKQISNEDFCFVKIPYPNVEEQKAISAILEHADKEIELANKKLANLQAQKKGLMQVLLTGKRRVTNE